MLHSAHIRRALGFAAFAVTTAVVLSGCAAGSADNEKGGPTELTLWVRAANEAKTAALADAYNATHDDQVTVTAFPDDQFVTRVGTSTASGEVPDLLATDAVYMPTFIEQGIYLDISNRIAEFDHADDLFPSLLEASTGADGSIYAVPRDPGTSLLFWNKDLYEKAGLDPEVGPQTWDEVVEHAAAIDALDDDVSGYYLAGNCAGCNAFTYMPMVWAAGGELLNEDGATFEDPANVAGLEFLNELYAQGSIPEGARSDGGENWLTGFLAGKVGIQPLGSFAIAALKNDAPGVAYGVSPLPADEASDGASFVGGDVLGIPAQSKNADAAWDFIEWTLSDEVQLDIVAKSGELVSRTDLVDNEYSTADPNVVIANDAISVGRVPQSLYYQQLIQDPNGPFLLMFQSGVFDGDAATAAAAAQEAADAIVAANQ